MRIRRAIAATALAALTGMSLSACQTKVGAAAVVGGQRITESSVADYVTVAGPTAKVLRAAAKAKQRVEPRVRVVSELILARVVENALTHLGGVPTDAQLSAVHDEAVSRLINNSATATGDSFDAGFRKQVVPFGFSPRYAGLLVHTVELEDTVINRTKVTSVQALDAKISSYPIELQVSPRYGSWDPTTLALSLAARAGAPGFVHFGVTTPATSAG